MDVRALEIRDRKAVEKELLALKVHKGGIEIMAPKAVTRVVKVSGIDSAALNILKQEMLSAGGDCAVAWDAFEKRSRRAEGLVIGTVSQIGKVCEKLGKQPFGLAALAGKLESLEANLENRGHVLLARKYRLNLGKRAHIMGILNVTPDSFSDGGRYIDKEYAVARAVQMESEGADIIDVGGESTRPGAKPVPAAEEIRRVIPVLKVLKRRLNAPVSIDTSKAEVARAALDEGASIINDVTGLSKDRRMAKLAGALKAAVVLMHMKGTPRTMQVSPKYGDLIAEITASLKQSADLALEAGVAPESIVVDPGIGFGKTPEHNLEILRRLGEFRSLGYPVMAGPSRKRFIDKVTGLGAEKRIFGTAAAVAMAVNNGAGIIRVHDVKEMRQAVQITEAILNDRTDI